MQGFIKNSTVIIFALILIWVFSGWPRVWNFPPKVQEVQALDVANGDGILFYAASANTTPQWRTYTNSTNDFSANSGTVVGAQPVINQIKTSPTKQEAIAAYQDTSGNLRVLCYDGNTWTQDWTVAVAGAGTPTTRRFDIAYETNTGDVTVAYSRNTAAANALAYRTKSGSTGCGSANWAAAANFPTTTTVTSATVMWVKAARDGRSAQNLSAWVWLDNAATNADLGGAIWSGSAFTNFKSLETSMEHQSAVGDSDNFDVQYESLSGDVMVVWGNSAGASNVNGYRYNTCTGGTSGCTWLASGATLGTSTAPYDECMSIDLSADPLSDKMAMAGIGGVTFDMSAGYWPGSTAWTGYANVDATTETTVSVGSKKVTTGWLTNNGNTKWYISYDDHTGTGISYKYAIDGGAITTPGEYTSTPALTDLRGRYDTDMNPFNNAELIQTVSDDTNGIFAYKLSMDAAGALSWSDMATAVSLGSKPSHPQQGFSYTYWRFIPSITTLSTGTNPGNSTIAPGGAITSVNGFTLTTSAGTDAITAIIVNLSTNSGVGTLTITDGADTVLGSIGGGIGTGIVTGSNSISITSTDATTGGTAFKVKVTPLSHTNMPAPNGGEYAITGVVTDWTGSNTKVGQATDTSDTVTIDNLSPNGATATSTSAGNQQVTLNWTTSNSSDFSRSVVLRWTGGSAGSEVPEEGTDYTIVQDINTAAVACVRTTDGFSTAVTDAVDGSGGGGGCRTTALANDQAYTYKVFQKDSNGNYDVGVSLGSATPFSSTVSCDVDLAGSSTAFGPLSVGSVTTASPNASTTMTCTYSGGCTLSVSDVGAGANQPGLATTTPAYLVSSPNAAYDPTAVLAAGTEGYGITATSTAGGSGGTLTIYSRYDVDSGGDRVGGLKTGGFGLASSTLAITNRQLVIKHKIAISVLTMAAKYEDSITYSCAGN